MPPCLTLSIIRYGSSVKWSNPGKGVAPSPTPWCSKLSKREPSGHPRLWSSTYLYIHIVFLNSSFFLWFSSYLSIHLHWKLYIYIYIYSVFLTLPSFCEFVHIYQSISTETRMYENPPTYIHTYMYLETTLKISDMCSNPGRGFSVSFVLTPSGLDMKPFVLQPVIRKL